MIEKIHIPMEINKEICPNGHSFAVLGLITRKDEYDNETLSYCLQNADYCCICGTALKKIYDLQ